jgi:replicative DNA helicase
MKKQTTKVQPHNPEAEMTVIGSILLDSSYLSKVLSIIKPTDFYETKHTNIFKAMISMEKFGIEITLVTLSEHLLKFGNLEMVGGPPYLQDLMEATPTPTVAVSHAKVIREKARLRTLIAISTQLNMEAYGERVDVQKLIERAGSLIDDIRAEYGSTDKDWTVLKDSLLPTFNEIERLNEATGEVEESSYIPTGFRDLDDKIIGLFKSELIILGARPSQGKTSLGLNIGIDVAMRGHPVAAFSIETATQKATERILCTEAKVDSHDIHKRQLPDDDWPRIVNAVGRLTDLPFYIYDSSKLSLQEFKSRSKAAVRDKGIELIIIDYLTRMRIDGVRDPRIMYSEIAEGIKSTAKDLNIPILCLSQLSRAVESRKPPRPILSDLKETGNIEQEADVVLLLYNPGAYAKVVDEYGLEDKTVEIIVGKNRNGPTGIVKAVFEKKYTRFHDIERVLG